jgi:hypothetical protein
MSDLSERPPVPPEETGGDEAIGYAIAGAVLIALGFGVGVILNVLLHQMAGTSTLAVGPWVVSGTYGPYAEAILAGGLLTGAFGLVLLALAQRTPGGRFVLPGGTY